MSRLPTTISIKLVHPESDSARQALRDYYTHIVGRYHGRPATEAEVESVLADEPSADLQPPYGLFWVVRDDHAVLGCVGLRLLPDGIGEVTRVYVAEHARRQGLGSRLLHEVEDAARAHRRSALRLDTRHDLVEARQLYRKHGYLEIPAFNTSPYAEHWFAKTLD